MKILLIDTIHPVFSQLLSRNKFEVIDGTTWSREEVLKKINAYNGVCIRSRIKVDKEFLSNAGNLKFIARAGAGMENIDVVYAESKGIKCFNSPEGNRDAVGEHAIGMLLSLFNKLNKSDAEVRKGTWKREENRGVELAGKTVGIIGFGNMGSTFAKKLAGFNAEIIAYDKYGKIDNVEFPFVQQVEMKEIFERIDVLSLHIPLTDETNYLVNDKYINRFRKNIYLINTSRGKNVNTADLVKNIQSGKIAGACLDVLEYETSSFENLDGSSFPESFQFLVNSDNVILSPHIAGWTVESNEKIATVLAQKIISAFGKVA